MKTWRKTEPALILNVLQDVHHLWGEHITSSYSPSNSGLIFMTLEGQSFIGLPVFRVFPSWLREWQTYEWNRIIAQLHLAPTFCIPPPPPLVEAFDDILNCYTCRSHSLAYTVNPKTSCHLWFYDFNNAALCKAKWSLRNIRKVTQKRLDGKKVILWSDIFDTFLASNAAWVNGSYKQKLRVRGLLIGGRRGQRL